MSVGKNLSSSKAARFVEIRTAQQPRTQTRAERTLINRQGLFEGMKIKRLNAADLNRAIIVVKNLKVKA